MGKSIDTFPDGRGLAGPDRTGYGVGFRAALRELFPIEGHAYVAIRNHDGTVDVYDPMKPPVVRADSTKRKVSG